MYKEEIHFGKLLFKQSETVWHIWPRWPWPSDPKINCPGRMYGQSLKKVGQGVLELLIGNEKVTDGQTDRHAHLSKGSIITIVILWKRCPWIIQRWFSNKQKNHFYNYLLKDSRKLNFTLGNYINDKIRAPRTAGRHPGPVQINFEPL